MDWRLLPLLGAGCMLSACSGGDTPAAVEPGAIAPAATPDISSAGRRKANRPPETAQSMRTDFPFPVLSGWTERNRLEVRDLPAQVLASTWIHDGDPAAHAIAYRRLLEAAGYRIGPGQLSSSSEIAFTGTGPIAGQAYRFAIDFSREAGDQRVDLVFIPCRPAC